MWHDGDWKRRFGAVSAAICMAMLLFSCQSRGPSDQSRDLSDDVQLLARIQRATSRYRAALDLAGNAQTAVERSLAERHYQINRDILKLEFELVKSEIEGMAALKSKEKGKQAKQTGGAAKQQENAEAEAAKIDAQIENAGQQVSRAERRLNEARSAQEIKNAQADLIRAQQALQIANNEKDLSETDLKIAEVQRKESEETNDDIKSLRNRIALREKEVLGKEATDSQMIKWSDQSNAQGAGLMGAFSRWWSLYDKGNVLDRAEQRAKRLSASLKDTQSDNQKQLAQLRDQQRTLNQQIQSLYAEANQLLKQTGQEAQTNKLLEEADAKMKESITCGVRRENISHAQDIYQQQLVLANEDDDKLADWIQTVSDSRARSLNRLLQRAGSLLGMILVVFIAAYFIKKIPSRFAKEEKSAYYFRKLIGFIAWLIVILIVIFNASGGIGSISAVIGLAGAGLAIALQDPIVSLVGWFLIVGKYGISVGDRIEINNVKGDVVDIGMLRIAVMEVGNWLSGEQSTGRMVYFPNSFIFKGHFFNYSATNSFIWDEIHILVTYESKWKKALDIILKVAQEASRDVVGRARESQEKLARRFNVNLGNPEPYTYVTIADSGVDLVLRYLSEIKLRRIARDRICREILEAFEKEKDIELAYPTQRQLTETRIISESSPAGKEGPEGFSAPRG
jgi:small-conductance mechanosensitive channel